MRVLFADCGNIEDFPESWLSGMDAEKRQHIGRLRHQKDRALTAAAHRLLCRGLKEEYGIVPKTDDWGKGEFGKPYLKNAESVCFNISHSGRISMCAVHNKQVGADIQEMRPVGDRLAMRVMSEAEKRVYFPERNEEVFFSIWTLKESYLKFKGCGIQGLNSITAYPEGDRVISNDQGCSFLLIPGIKGYKAAVCSEGSYELKYNFIDINEDF